MVAGRNAVGSVVGSGQALIGRLAGGRSVFKCMLYFRNKMEWSPIASSISSKRSLKESVILSIDRVRLSSFALCESVDECETSSFSREAKRLVSVVSAFLFAERKFWAGKDSGVVLDFLVVMTEIKMNRWYLAGEWI